MRLSALALAIGILFGGPAAAEEPPEQALPAVPQTLEDMRQRLIEGLRERGIDLETLQQQLQEQLPVVPQDQPIVPDGTQTYDI